MKLFTNDSLPLWIWGGGIAALAIFGSLAHDHVWARYVLFALMAPFPIVGVYLGVMAYGEWLFGLVSLWQTDQNEFFNCMYPGIGRMVFALGFIGLIVGFIWALDPPNNWILWEVVKYSFYLAVVSIVSFFSYRYHRRWKIRHRWREFIRRIHTAAAERIHPSR